MPTPSMFLRAARPIRQQPQKLDGRVYETAAPAVWFLAVDSKGIAKTGDICEWRAPIRVKPDVKRVSGGYKVVARRHPARSADPGDFRRLRPEDWAGGPQARSTRRRGRPSCALSRR